MAIEINRAKELYENWKNKQMELEEFGVGTESAIRKLKYVFLTKGLNRISVNPNPEEQIFIRLIQSATVKLRRQVYPNPIVRVIHRLRQRLIDTPNQVRLFREKKEENLFSLNRQLKEAGFSSFTGKLENYLDFERNKIEVSMTSQIKNNRSLDIQLRLIKDNYGLYKMDQYTASIVHNDSKEPIRSITIPSKLKISASEAMSLLEGRALRKIRQGHDGQFYQTWFQLDLNNQNIGGEFKMKQFHEDYKYDLDKILNDYSEKLSMPSLKDQYISENLFLGKEVNINIPGNGDFTLKANPTELNIEFYNSENKQVDFKSLIKKVNSPITKNIEDTKVIKLPKDKNHTVEDSQSLAIN